MLGDANSNECSEVAFLVATFRRSHHSEVIRREKRAEDGADKRSDVVGEKADHIIIAFDVGKSTTVHRLFPKRDEEHASAVGDTHSVRSEIAASFGNVEFFPRLAFLLLEQVF